MRKGFVGLLSLLLAVTVIGIGAYYYMGRQAETASQILPTVKPLEEQKPLVGGDTDIHGCIGSAGYTWCEGKQKCLRQWEEPCSDGTPVPTADETQTIIAAIRQALIAKHGPDAGKLTITVSKIIGTYAQGGASAPGGGAMWFAVKENGTWKLIWDGNGVILCTDISAYPELPKAMISECYDEAAKKPRIR